jgi:hypothetical protein
MLIERVVPEPPTHIRMSFPLDEGWAVVAALKDYAEQHPDAAGVDKWAKWAQTLDAELRR